MYNTEQHSNTKRHTPNASADTLLRIDRFGRIFSDAGTSQSTRATLGAGALLVQRQDVGVATLVSLFGALDRTTAPAFVDLVGWLQSQTPQAIHLDLTGLRVVDVAGMAAVDALTDVEVLLESEAIVQLRRLVEGIDCQPHRAA